MIKKIMIGLGFVAVAAVLATSLIAGAQTVFSMTSGPSATPSYPMTLLVDPAGKVLLRGTIDSVTSGVLAVKSWGGDWTVNVGSGTQILPGAASNDITKFKIGDFVGVQGTVSKLANWAIDATLVRDRTAEYRGRPQTFVGTASNASGTSFTLTVNGTAYTVIVTSGTQVVNRRFLMIQLSSIQNGDKVIVRGVNASGTMITAQTVRDISIPAAGTH